MSEQGVTITPAVITMIIGAILFILAVASGLILILSRKREDVHLTESKRADANEKLLKTREVELEECNNKHDKIAEELEDTTVELRALSGVKLSELIAWAKEYDQFMVRLNTAESENRRYKVQLGLSDPPNS